MPSLELLLEGLLVAGLLGLSFGAVYVLLAGLLFVEASLLEGLELLVPPIVRFVAPASLELVPVGLTELEPGLRFLTVLGLAFDGLSGFTLVVVLLVAPPLISVLVVPELGALGTVIPGSSATVLNRVVATPLPPDVSSLIFE